MPKSVEVEYTIELYRADKRIKNPSRFSKDKVGLRHVDTLDYEPCTKTFIDHVINDFHDCGFVTELHETYVTRKNLMTGKEFQERYDTPYYCSPSSETYFSM